MSAENTVGVQPAQMVRFPLFYNMARTPILASLLAPPGVVGGVPVGASVAPAAGGDVVSEGATDAGSMFVGGRVGSVLGGRKIIGEVVGRLLSNKALNSVPAVRDKLLEVSEAVEGETNRGALLDGRMVRSARDRVVQFVHAASVNRSIPRAASHARTHEKLRIVR
ncbi:MAG: hypothetical protein QW429_00430 [Thermoprotei archaeon]